MYFTKYPHRANFSFVDRFDEETGKVRAGRREFGTRITAYEGDVYHVQITHPDTWDRNHCIEPLVLPPASDRRRLKAGPNFELTLLGREGHPILRSAAGESFGVSGDASMFQFAVGQDASFFGMGEKTFGTLELSGHRTKFWNTDVWGDFDIAQWTDRPTDPPYFSTPYLVVKTGDEYVGLLLHNPYPTFIETPVAPGATPLDEFRPTSKNLVLGAEGGEPNLWVIYGPSLAELTCKLQKLVGVTPLPPIWSLGYHQSRWGYEGHDDLVRVDAEFEKNKIPCDGLWMDLEHMRGYRIFNTSAEAFPDGPQATADILAKNHRRIVPILDPGVKFEKGLNVYEDGHEKDVFCHNAEGAEFVGLVWPGETVFPDFTLPEAREWWAGYVKSWFEEGFGATWVDMNDPSTGPVDPQGMLFRRGSEPHARHHNQYALGMQMATKQGFAAAKPNERCFMLSRSGFVSTSKYSAVWSGDNVSNYFYLRISIPEALGMSLSGLPFTGPDLGGFGGDCDEDLMIAWVKAGFLFPFFRNHSAKGTRNQEPFTYSRAGMETIRRYIRLRYKLMPALYNLFVDQEETGAPPMRPLLYHYEQEGLEKIDDQFMVGPFILHAPFLNEGQRTRTVVLPGVEPWYDARTGAWLDPGTVTAKTARSETPLYVAAGAIIPMQKGTPTDNTKELRDVIFHVFVPEGWSGDTEIVYRADDGLSFEYRNGGRSTLKIRLVGAEGNLAIVAAQTESGFGEIKPSFVIHGPYASIRVNGEAPATDSNRMVMTGKWLNVTVLS